MGVARTNTFTVRVPVWQIGGLPSCPLAAGVLGSLPTCAQGSPVLGPAWRNSSVPVWVLLGFLVVLICGLLIVLSSRASCRSYHKEHLFFPPSSGLGVSYGGFGICAPVGNPEGPLIGQGIMAFLGVGIRGVNWLPCMLAWWGSLRLSGYDA